MISPLVHNGIIENADTLRAALVADGGTFAARDVRAFVHLLTRLRCSGSSRRAGQVARRLVSPHACRHRSHGTFTLLVDNQSPVSSSRPAAPPHWSSGEGRELPRVGRAGLRHARTVPSRNRRPGPGRPSSRRPACYHRPRHARGSPGGTGLTSPRPRRQERLADVHGEEIHEQPAPVRPSPIHRYLALDGASPVRPTLRLTRSSRVGFQARTPYADRVARLSSTGAIAAVWDASKWFSYPTPSSVKTPGRRHLQWRGNHEHDRARPPRAQQGARSVPFA